MPPPVEQWGYCLTYSESESVFSFKKPHEFRQACLTTNQMTTPTATKTTKLSMIKKLPSMKGQPVINGEKSNVEK